MPARVTWPLHQMFTAVPPRYDLINRIVTLGMDERWRSQAAAECLSSGAARILDVCCGTGDLALRLARMSDSTITGLDYSEPMLEIARTKADRIQGDNRPTFLYGDVAELPFPDGHFDCVGIAFAFRNLTYKNPNTERYLSEIFRVIRPGGRFVIVESSQPRNAVIRLKFRVYLRGFVYPVGYLLSGNRGAYRYLAESASRFYGPEEIEGLLRSAGFGNTRYRPLLFGAAGIYVALKA